jgi:lactate permease
VEAVLAALPIAVVLVAMLGFGWSAARAGLLGLGVSILLAWGPFRELFAAEVGVLAATAGSMAEALFTSLTILWIIIPALALHQMQASSGALAAMEDRLSSVTGDPRVLALLVAWFFALFMEGAAGFGTAAALAAPFLVAAGFPPIQAVILALVGHAAGVSFGAVGTPILPQVLATEFSPLQLARATSVYHAVLGGGLAAVVVFLASRSPVPGDRDSTPVPATITAALLFLVPYTALAWLLGPELPTLGGALIGGLLFIPLVRRFRPLNGREASADPHRTLWAAAPYVGVTALVVVTRLVPGWSGWLSEVDIEWSLPGGFGAGFAPLYHPGTMVAGGLLLGWLAQRLPGSELSGALRRSLNQVGAVAVALVAMLGLSRIMVASGMIEELAGALAGLAGAGWPALAPFVGALGTFVTGSATASNILLTDLQDSTARSLGMPALPLIGAQGFGAAAGNMIAPHNLIAAVAVVQATGREGDVLRKTIWVAALYLAGGAALAMAATHLFS